MKRVAFFVLAFIAIVIADDKDIEEIAEKFGSDVAEVKICLEELKIDTKEILPLLQNWENIKPEEITEDVKQSLTTYSLFLACILEKTGMMVDSKLVTDKLIEDMEADKEIVITDKKALEECINSLNEDSQLTRENRVFGLMLCTLDQMGEDKK
ncbi:PREDICTED: uncharacterized protein LOC105566330 [Vollenhovia emeryi]|uniref:uncharacterized protein LOC105566330 n=1 Tax=Vollenhovia emeryi TaxID=411798 RepID=UPI0005F57F53|nr:PREDICTED: uncharacterized protein LOC105566330 [Vollenhovia emeryi]